MTALGAIRQITSGGIYFTFFGRSLNESSTYKDNNSSTYRTRKQNFACKTHFSVVKKDFACEKSKNNSKNLLDWSTLGALRGVVG